MSRTKTVIAPGKTFTTVNVKLKTTKPATVAGFLCF